MDAVRHAGRVVGRMDGRLFVRIVDPQRHQLRSPAAWCHDDALLTRLERAGCVGIRLDDIDGTRSWLAPLAVIRAKGFPVHRPGWPEQTGLVLSEWALLEIRQATAEEIRRVLAGAGAAA